MSGPKFPPVPLMLALGVLGLLQLQPMGAGPKTFVASVEKMALLLVGIVCLFAEERSTSHS